MQRSRLHGGKERRQRDDSDELERNTRRSRTGNDKGWLQASSRTPRPPPQRRGPHSDAAAPSSRPQPPLRRRGASSHERHVPWRRAGGRRGASAPRRPSAHPRAKEGSLTGRRLRARARVPDGLGLGLRAMHFGTRGLCGEHRGRRASHQEVGHRGGLLFVGVRRARRNRGRRGRGGGALRSTPQPRVEACTTTSTVRANRMHLFSAQARGGNHLRAKRVQHVVRHVPDCARDRSTRRRGQQRGARGAHRALGVC